MVKSTFEGFASPDDPVYKEGSTVFIPGLYGKKSKEPSKKTNESSENTPPDNTPSTDEPPQK